MGRVVVICSQSTEIYTLKCGIFFITSRKAEQNFEVHCEYWYYLRWFYSDHVNNLVLFSIYSNKVVHELLQKPRKKFLHQVEILLRNHGGSFWFCFFFKKGVLGFTCGYLCKLEGGQRLLWAGLQRGAG